MLPNWSCSKKFQYRWSKIIDPAQKLFGPILPPEKQYWAMSGKCANEGSLISGCEYDQMVNLNFVKPQQFFSADKDALIIEHNKCLPGTWLNLDFLRAMKQSASAGTFNPGVVHADFIRMPRADAKTFADIISFITGMNIDNVIVVGNFVLKTYHHSKQDGNALIDELSKYKLFTDVIGQWQFDQQCYEYNGTGKRSTSVMGAIVLVKGKAA